MKWRLVVRPEVEQDVAEAAAGYESRQPGLGAAFVEEIIRVWDALEENPLLNARPTTVLGARGFEGSRGFQLTDGQAGMAPVA